MATETTKIAPARTPPRFLSGAVPRVAVVAAVVVVVALGGAWANPGEAWLARFALLALVLALPGTAFLLLWNRYADLESSILDMRRQHDEEARHSMELTRRFDSTEQELQHRREMMDKELEYARKVQENFLPAQYPFRRALFFSSYYNACTGVGGDLYGVLKLSPRVAAIYMADVSGHGVSAALITATFKQKLERALGWPEPDIERTSDQIMRPEFAASAVAQVNDRMGKLMGEGRFITMQLILLEVSSGRLVVVNAGHQPPIHYSAEKEQAREIPVPANLPIGLVGEVEFDVAEHHVEVGDKLVMYTDGMIEHRAQNGDEFGEKQFVKAVGENGKQTSQRMLELIRSSIRSFCGSVPAEDDESILVMEYRPSGDVYSSEEIPMLRET